MQNAESLGAQAKLLKCELDFSCPSGSLFLWNILAPFWKDFREILFRALLLKCAEQTEVQKRGKKKLKDTSHEDLSALCIVDSHACSSLVQNKSHFCVKDDEVPSASAYYVIRSSAIF